MRRPRLLIALLVLATVLVDAVVWSMLVGDASPAGRAPNLGHILLESLVVSQIQLIAIWAAFGGKSTPWRLLIVALAIAVWARLFAEVIDTRGLPDGLVETLWTVHLLAHAIVLVTLVAIARLAGVGISTVSAPGGPKPQAMGPARIQFFLRDLFSWLTALAVALGVLPFALNFGIAPETIPDCLDAGNWFRIATVTAADVAITLAALWTALSTERPTLRIAILCVAWSTLGVIRLRLHLPGVWWHAVVLSVVQPAWILASLAVVRVAGYRLVRVRREA